MGKYSCFNAHSIAKHYSYDTTHVRPSIYVVEELFNHGHKLVLLSIMQSLLVLESLELFSLSLHTT